MDGWLQIMAFTACMAGLLGGAHCAAMCGGIVSLTYAPGTDGKPRSAFYPLTYNLGRIASYIVAGALAQHLLMFLMGAMLIVVALNVAGVRPVTSGI